MVLDRYKGLEPPLPNATRKIRIQKPAGGDGEDVFSFVTRSQFTEKISYRKISKDKFAPRSFELFGMPANTAVGHAKASVVTSPLQTTVLLSTASIIATIVLRVAVSCGARQNHPKD